MTVCATPATTRTAPTAPAKGTDPPNAWPTRKGPDADQGVVNATGPLATGCRLPGFVADPIVHTNNDTVPDAASWTAVSWTDDPASTAPAERTTACGATAESCVGRAKLQQAVMAAAQPCAV